jgi:hypothetical protein
MITVAITPSTPGTKNCCRSVSPDDRRHESSGPTPVKKSRMSPMGTIHTL